MFYFIRNMYFYIVSGDTLFLSGLDILDGTPVLDIKPYIPSYDMPTNPSNLYCNNYDLTDENTSTNSPSTVVEAKQTPTVDVTNDSQNDVVVVKDANFLSWTDTKLSATGDLDCRDMSVSHHTLKEETAAPVVPCNEQAKKLVVDNVAAVPDWLQEGAIANLQVEFTPRAQSQLDCFSLTADDAAFRTEYLTDSLQCKDAITAVLQADPRSAYRRCACADRLYYFTCDRLHVTAWFDGNVAEVLKVQSVSDATYLNTNSIP